ncbi:MAG: endonuclease [Paludibacteraceae bacterium]|nr:endonuclease [Paludibacteraceae bacterium]
MKSLKVLCAVWLVCCTVYVSAEDMPAGYYNAIQGTKDSMLKTALHQIIKGGERYIYGPSTYHTTNKIQNGDTIWKVGDLKAYGTWHGFQSSDQQSDGTIWDMYSTTKRYFPIKGGSAAGMDIEHSLPKSWWGGDENDAYIDLYHLNPADRVANNNKSNYPPGILNDSNKVNNGIFFMGKDKEWNDYAFSVIDEYKGDFARAYFYISTAYHDMKWDATYSKYVTNSSYLTFTSYLIEVLLQWHRIDPVSEKEINRLDAISSIQHNRNPFIEYPELVEYIWGNKRGEVVDISQLTRTTSEDYTIPTDTINPEAYPATEVTTNSFTANWKDQDRNSYLLEVFTLQHSGHNDTLVSMPGFNKDIVSASNNKLQWLKEDGTTAQYRQMDGSHATSLSSTTEKRQIRFTNFGKASQNTFLTVRCCVFKGDKSADLQLIDNNNNVLYTQPLSLDEEYYTFSIPEGTMSISLMQKEIGTKSKGYHRISVQEAYLYYGDYQSTEVHLEGSPFTLTDISYSVTHELPVGTSIYYRVTPEGLRTSNTITTYPYSSTDIPTITTSTATYKKIIQHGELYIVRDNNTYDILGRKHE